MYYRKKPPDQNAANRAKIVGLLTIKADIDKTNARPRLAIWNGQALQTLLEIELQRIDKAGGA